MATQEIKVTPNREEVIRNLYGESPAGVAPMWFGGSNGSHHSATAAALCKTDPPLVERRYRGGSWGGRAIWAQRGSCVYRLTQAGNEVAEQRLGCKPRPAPAPECVSTCNDPDCPYIHP